MTEIGEVALWFAIFGWIFALCWGFFVVAWRAREMIVAFLTSDRAGKVWAAAESHIVPPLLKRMDALEGMVRGEIVLLPGRFAESMPDAPDVESLRAEMQEGVAKMREVHSTLMGNLTKMRHAFDRLDAMEAQAAKLAASQLGLEAQGVDPQISQKVVWAKMAARLNPEDPSLSTLESIGVSLAKQALLSAQNFEGGGAVFRMPAGSSDRRPTDRQTSFTTTL